MRSTDLSDLQLVIAMHIANGMTFDEIAKTVDRSTANVKKHANAARRKTNSRTLPQLVSVLIASEQLTWNSDRCVVNESRGARANGGKVGSVASGT